MNDARLTPRVYQYQSPRQFLLDFVEAKQKQRPGFSVRQWSQKMGMPSHSLLTLMLQGKRKILARHVSTLDKGISFSSPERLYFQTLVQLENAKTAEEKIIYQKFLTELNPEGEFTSKELEDYAIFSNWIHMAILSMTRLKGFHGSEDEIYQRLKKRSSRTEIRAALSRLMDHGLLVANKNGKLEASFGRVSTLNDTIQEATRVYHRKMMELASEAIDEQALDEREFQSFALAIDEAKLPQAKEMIRQFRMQFAKTVGAKVGQGTKVYQMGIQFFGVTDSVQERKKS